MRFQEVHQAVHGIAIFGKNQHLTLWFLCKFVPNEALNTGGFGMKFSQVVQGQSKLVNGGQGQHTVCFTTVSPFFFCSVQKGLSDLGPLSLKQVDENVHSTKIGDPSSSVVAPHVSLLNRSAGALLRPFDVVGSDVGLCWHEALTLEVSHLVVEMSFQGCDEGGQGFWEVNDVRVDLHVHVVGGQQRVVALAEVQVVSVEVGANVVDVPQG